MNQKFENALECIGIIATAILFVLLMILYCIATPNQMSAECDYARAQLESSNF